MEITNVTYHCTLEPDAAVLEKLPSNLSVLLESINGFIQYNGGIHVRGAVTEPKWHSISEVWEGSCAIHKMYPQVEAADIPFAQDSVGDQFLLRNSQVWRLSAETGEVQDLELGLKSFFEAIASNPVEFLEMEPLMQLHHEGGAL